MKHTFGNKEDLTPGYGGHFILAKDDQNHWLLPNNEPLGNLS